MSKKDWVRPYGDTIDDGEVQLSFTLPTPFGAHAEEAAKQLVSQMGFDNVRLAVSRDVGNGFSFFVAYGRTKQAVDMNSITIDVALSQEAMGMHEVDELLERELDAPVVVVGACIGSDAHTVGIDAILNMKGFAGDYGLERYHMMEAHNLGSQVPPEELIRQAVVFNASVILVSQVVTQKEVHVHQLTRLVELLEAEGLRDRFLLIVGGPYINNALAKELGYDAGFGRGTKPSHVATYIAQRMIEDKNGTEDC
jgi:beta-lysine 5,6-aminomutase beta subunit